MGWITDLFKPKYLDWEEYKKKIETIEDKRWKEKVEEENRKNTIWSS